MEFNDKKLIKFICELFKAQHIWVDGKEVNLP